MSNCAKLTITASVNKFKVSISSKDTGLGNSENVKPQILQRLFTTKEKGQGLGLAVVKRLTKALNVAVHFESQEGHGTAFIVKLLISAKESAY
jgi:signal transduction histidine kinase